MIKLPYAYPNGTDVYLGEEGIGYPSELYPNLTYTTSTIKDTTTQATAYYQDRPLSSNSTLFIGPLTINETYSLFSVTLAINNNTSRSDTLGWLTIVLDARMLYNIVNSPEGLQTTGQVLLIGPDMPDNMYPNQIRNVSRNDAESQQVRFVLPPLSNSSLGYRHSLRSWQSGSSSRSFPMRDYPAVVDSWTRNNHADNNAAALIDTHNEEGKRVSVGYATLANRLVDWTLVSEQSHGKKIYKVHHHKLINI